MSDELIKKYTQELATNPKSRSFVPLADLYRKLSRHEEAISVAKEGVKNHPHYLAGKMALARAYFEYGEAEEAQALLEDVVRLAPDNLMANRLLVEIYNTSGELEKAGPMLRQILLVDPSDTHAKDLLDKAQKAPEGKKVPSDERDAVSEQKQSEAPQESGIAATPPTPPESQPHPDSTRPSSPMETADGKTPSIQKRGEDGQRGVGSSDSTASTTLGDLYRSQGHLEKALSMYEEVLKMSPESEDVKRKIEELRKEMASKEAPQEVPSGKAAFLTKLLSRISERRRSL